MSVNEVNRDINKQYTIQYIVVGPRIIHFINIYVYVWHSRAVVHEH